MHDFSVIVPVFNKPSYTKACLDSVIAHSKPEIVVVDNGSIGRTRRLLASYGDKIKIIRNDKNLGIAPALNQGIKAATKDNIVMLHNDCVVAPGFGDDVMRCFAAMTGSIRLASPITNYSDESTFVHSKALMDHFVSIKPSNKAEPSDDEVASLLLKTYSKYGGLAELATKVSGELEKVGEVSSFCLMVQRQTLQQAGGFNEEFRFRRYEDKELLFRCLDLGCFAGKAPFFVHHFGNITSDGPGFALWSLEHANAQTFEKLRREWLRGNGGQKPWTAVVFPERNYPELTARAISALNKLNLPPLQIVQIPHPGFYPIKEAWGWVLPQVRYDFLGMVDADMILKKDAAEVMLRAFDQNIGMSAAWLSDDTVGRVSNPVFWRTRVLREIMKGQPPPIDYELWLQAECRKQGMDIAWLEPIVGEHRPHLDPWSIFRAFFRRGIKSRIRGMGKPMALYEIEGAIAKNTPWSHIAMVGFHTGLSVDYNGDPHDETFDAFTNMFYNRVKPFCEMLASKATKAEVARPAKDNRIRVALLCECLEIGGMEIVISILDKLIDRSKYDVRIYSRVGGALESSLKSDIRISNKPRGMMGAQVAEWLFRDEIEVAVSMSFWGADDIFRYGKSCRFVERMDGPKYGYVKTPGVTDVAVFESETMFSLLSPDYPCKNRIIIPNGREAFAGTSEDRQRVRSQLRIDDSEVLIANVARMHECKNQRDQILMVEELLKRSIKNFMLVIMGPDQGGRKDLEALIKERNVSTHVKLIDGSTDGVPAMLAAADIAINTSPSEGLAGSLVEALHAGLPIVATDVGATKDIVSNANGALVPFGSAVKLADAVQGFISSHERRRSAAEASRALASKYSAEAMVGGFEKLIAEQGEIHRRERSRAPLVTVLMPVWNRHQFMAEAIQSIIRQTFRNWEMIITIDDEVPTPEIMEVIQGNRDPRVTWICNQHKNQCAALNHAMRYVKGPYAVRLDSDDILEPFALETLSEHISKNPEAGYFYSERTFIDDDGNDISDKFPGAGLAEDFSPRRLEEWYIARAMCAWKTTDFVRAGGFDEEITYGEDYLLPLTMMLMGTKFVPIKRSLYRYRFHGAGNVSAISSPDKDAYVNLVRAKYQRLKHALGVSWEGESPSTMKDRNWKRT